VDPAEILQEYRKTRFPERFFNLKIGIPWADLERRLDVASVLSLCSSAPMQEKVEGQADSIMGVDTGKDLHVVILRDAPEDSETEHLVHLAVCQDFAELDDLMKRFKVERCVIDGLPETHATRDFAHRHRGKVFMCFFNETQRGSAHREHATQIVQVNRTEALDASRAAVRQKKLVLPRRVPLVELFAQHMAADAKVLEEDEATEAKKYRYLRTGEDHFSSPSPTPGWRPPTGRAPGVSDRHAEPAQADERGRVDLRMRHRGPGKVRLCASLLGKGTFMRLWGPGRVRLCDAKP